MENLRKRERGSRSVFRNRKGFALILVFSLASIVLLLGLSLVSLTQVETASSQYDQGLKVARANARLALQMAVGDLQRFTGPDQRVTALADGARSGLGFSFNDPITPEVDVVHQPFWTGVWDNNNTTDNPVWLVTRRLDATYTIFDNSNQDANPLLGFDSGFGTGTSNDIVKLVGAGTAIPTTPGTHQTIHDVFVPKVPLLSDNIVGMTDTEQATIGHYAYWVGDNGVKASYLLEDQVPETLHDIYGTGDPPVLTYEQIRLEQLLAHRFHFEVDGDEVDAIDTRISSIRSEFALRKEGGDNDPSLLDTNTENGTYTHKDVLRRFHDFTGMSRGLLVDTVNGGLREDLSNIHEVDTGATPPDDLVDDLVNKYLMPYLNVNDFPTTTPPSDLRRAYSIAAKTTFDDGGPPTPTIAPVMTEFWLVIRMGAPKLNRLGPPGGTIGPQATEPPANEAEEDQHKSSNIYGQFGVSVELWNPYTSRINGEELRIRILNPHGDGLEVNYYDDYSPGDPPTVNNVLDGFGLEDVMNGVSEFQLDTSSTWWEPGEVRTFTGNFNPATGIIDLIPETTFPPNEYVYYYEISELPTFVSAFVGDYFTDRIELDGPAWSPVLTLETSADDELYRYSLSPISFYDMKSGIKRMFDSIVYRLLSYKWELRNPDSNWVNFDPRYGVIDGNLIMDGFVDPSGPPSSPYSPEGLGFFAYPGSNTAIDYTSIRSSSTDLLAYNDESPNVENNIPLFELPRQEYLSLGGLQMAEFPSGIKAHLGAPSASITPVASVNDTFDRFFLSGVPQGTTTWVPGDPLPNSRMVPRGGTQLTDLQVPDSAEHLFLNGAFNINSTSVEAWGAILKSVRLGTWAYDDPAGTTPVAGQSELDITGENQFFRFSQSAEETWRGTYDASDLDTARSLFRKGMRSLTDTEIASLAVGIVTGIRTRRQATSGLVGPYVGLQDFIDSGVIETAINATAINNTVRTDPGDPSTELPYASSYLTQQDVLTAIAPFLTARSDTFVVRAYGDAVNPFDDSRVLARAYCEAIVQRVHQKHSSEFDADPMTPTDNVAGALGRNYRIIAFRWLTGDEI